MSYFFIFTSLFLSAHYIVTDAQDCQKINEYEYTKKTIQNIKISSNWENIFLDKTLILDDNFTYYGEYNNYHSYRNKDHVLFWEHGRWTINNTKNTPTAIVRSEQDDRPLRSGANIYDGNPLIWEIKKMIITNGDQFIQWVQHKVTIELQDCNHSKCSFQCLKNNEMTNGQVNCTKGRHRQEMMDIVLNVTSCMPTSRQDLTGPWTYFADYANLPVYHFRNQRPFGRIALYYLYFDIDRWVISTKEAQPNEFPFLMSPMVKTPLHSIIAPDETHKSFVWEERCIDISGKSFWSQKTIQITHISKKPPHYKCGQCSPGTYKDSIGIRPCDNCPSDSFSWNHSVTRDSRDTCLCRANHFRTGKNTCQSCDNKQFSHGHETVVGKEPGSCLQCPQDYYKPTTEKLQQVFLCLDKKIIFDIDIDYCKPKIYKDIYKDVFALNRGVEWQYMKETVAEFMFNQDDAFGCSKGAWTTETKTKAKGKILLVQRGPDSACTFEKKILNAAELGAIAIVIFDNDENDIITRMECRTSSSIPSAHISKKIGEMLRNKIWSNQIMNSEAQPVKMVVPFTSCFPCPISEIHKKYNVDSQCPVSFANNDYSCLQPNINNVGTIATTPLVPQPKPSPQPQPRPLFVPSPSPPPPPLLSPPPLSANTEQEYCVVNRRIPSFALGLAHKQAKDVLRASESASRKAGGVCHMSRLQLVDNEIATSTDIEFSTQACTQDENNITCSILAQNDKHPQDSKVYIHNFTAHTPQRGFTGTETLHPRRALCSSCARANLTKVLSRLLKVENLKNNQRQQMSFGLPRRISTSRLIVSHLHRQICGANKTCPALARALGSDNLKRNNLIAHLFDKITFETFHHATHFQWSRNWVYCPHTDRNILPRTDPETDFRMCVGSITKKVWLDHKTRQDECRRALTPHQATSSPVNFCLMNAKTEDLCNKMAEWMRRTEGYLCQASGTCAESDFFYSPTTFNLQEQEFVHDTVSRFYMEDGQRDCPVLEKTNEQVLANEAVLQKCSSVSISPLLVVVDGFRTGKRALVLLTYHAFRVLFRVLELFLAATADAITNIAGETVNTMQAAAANLLTEITALMYVLGDFVNQIGESIMELVLSKGVGATFKEILIAVCKIVVWIFNNIWAKLLCHLIFTVLELWKMLLDVVGIIIKALITIGVNVKKLLEWQQWLSKTLTSIQSALNQCQEMDPSVCELALPSNGNVTLQGTLPMPTRCWTSYVTFFGDNQQLSCSAADTCKAGGLSADRVMCGACAVQQNPNVRDFGCDYVTSICTCAVPQLSSTSCLVNEDCQHRDSLASCLLINDDLQTSRAAVQCDQCQFQRICFHNSPDDTGVCACGARQRNFALCTVEDTRNGGSPSLMLNDLCLYTGDAGNTVFYNLEFAQTSVIPCQQLDPTAASCSYVVDINTYIIRGSRRGRRRLLEFSQESPYEEKNQHPAWKYESLDPTCRDALLSEALPHTRAQCQVLYDQSSATLVSLGLERQLPPCTLCTFADMLEATRSNPVAVLRIVMTPHMLATILRRHGLTQRLFEFVQTMHGGLGGVVARILAADSASLVVVQHIDGNVLVQVDDTIVPAPIARALEEWVAEVLRHEADTWKITRKNDTTQTNVGMNACLNDSQCACQNTSTCGIVRRPPHPSRRLLFFQELVMAVESRVRDGWDEADRLHEAFAQSIEQVLTYRDMPKSKGIGEQKWGTREKKDNCNELRDILLICIRVVSGIQLGWMTLTHERNKLQGRPASSLRDAWPRVMQPSGDNAAPDYNFNTYEVNDTLIRWATDAVNVSMQKLDIRPSIFYDVIFSISSAANSSFTCPYEAVQTCSHWRVRMWQGVVIIVFYFSIIAMITTAMGISFLSTLLVPFFGIVFLQLCYGYTWTCVPMIPVCMWQDFTESIHVVFPLSLELPDELKKTDLACRDLDKCLDKSKPCFSLPRYPSAQCLRSCRDPPFLYNTASTVLAWGIAEMGSWATTWVTNNSHHVPTLDHQHFNQQIRLHVNTLHRSSDSFVRAHRLCAGLSAYLLIPYVVLLLFIFGWIASILPLLTAQLYPFFLLFFALWSAASMNTNKLSYEDDVSEASSTDDEKEAVE